MTHEDDARQDLLRKIQGLMAKAEATEFEGERQAFMAKADELMNKYRIELWELQQKQVGRLSEREPVIRDFDYQFAFSSGPFAEICDALWFLFLGAARFANCVVVTRKQHYSGEQRVYKSYTIPVIGTEADLGYLTLLFTSLMTQLVEQIRPKYDPNKDYYRNLQTFKEAGWNWLETAKVMQENGHHTDVTTDKARHLTAHAYRRWCKAAGVEQNYSNWKTYRRNFADGFVARLNARLIELHGAEGTSDGSGMAIALRDQRQVNIELMDSEFPRERGSGRAMSVAKDGRKFDSAAYTGGRAAGDKAKITGDPGKGVGGKQRQLGS